MKDIQRTWIAALLLAAVVPAQQSTTPMEPPAALARARLLETQERDLQAAEQAYRALLTPDGRDAVQQEAAYRLGNLLWQLDRRAEATPFLAHAVSLGGAFGPQANALLQGQGEAQQQQQERLVRARALVARIVELHVENGKTTGNPVEAPLQAARRDLLWLGDAGAQAVAERLGALEPRVMLDVPDGRTDAEARFELSVLVPMLWRLGSPPARAFLDHAAADGKVEWRRLLTQGVTVVADDLEPVVARLLRDPDPTGDVPRNLEGLWSKLSPATLRSLAADEHPRARAAGLGGLATIWPKLPEEARSAAFPALAAVVRSAVRGAEPRAQMAAAALVQAFANHGPAEAQRLVLELLPDLPDGPGLVFRTTNPVREFRLDDDGFASLVDAARRLGDNAPSAPRSDARRAVELLLAEHTPAWTARSLDGLLRLAEAGYARNEGPNPTWFPPFFALGSGEQFGRCLRALPKMTRLQGLLLAQYQALDRARWPADLFAAIRDVVDGGLQRPVDGWPLLQRQQGPNGGTAPRPTPDLQTLLHLVGRTQDAEAPAWLLSLVERAPGTADWATEALVQLSGGGLGEPAWTALRTMLVWPGTADMQLGRDVRSRAFGELARCGDPAAIPRFGRAYALGLGNSAAYPKIQGSPSLPAKGIGHLGLSLDVQNQPGEPLHGYRDPELLQAWRTLLQCDASDEVWDELYSMKDRIPLAVLPVLAEALPAAFAKATPPVRNGAMWNVIGTFGKVGPDDVAAGSPIRAAIESLLRTEDLHLATNLFVHLRRPVAQSFAAEARALLRRTPWPGAFLERMLAAGLPISPEEWQLALQDPDNRASTLHHLPVPLPAELRGQVEQMLHDDAVMVRTAACSALARLLAADAVPALLAALQDQDEAVRKAATEALERIRFHSEQQAYWQDARAGIQTSPQSAAAKLLRQAQPQEPKEQRLLALRSLGVLGAAESLPYLIDWTKDADGDVAAAARAAIAQIHGKAGAPK